MPLGAAPETINAVVDEMRKAVKQQTQLCMAASTSRRMCESEGEIIDLFESEFINQAIENVDKMNNTTDTEKAMAKGFDALK